MNKRKAEILLREPNQFFHHDRVFINNPVVTLGMGLAPLVVMATNGKNALMLAVAVTLLLTPTRVLGSLLLGRVRKLLARGIGYCAIAAMVYIAVYQILSRLFGTDLLSLGIYLPMLCMEPLIIYRSGSKPETPRRALSKGLRVTCGYVLVLLVLGCLREILAYGTLFGNVLNDTGILPMASMPAGGFITLGVLCAAWRACVRRYKKFLVTEAHNQTVAGRSEPEGRQAQ
jgi:electron transport complex protein RnfE